MIQLFTLKHPTIEAIRYIDSPDVIKEIVDFTNGEAVYNDGVLTLNELFTVKEGDYVVKNHKGQFFASDYEMFNNLYVCYHTN